MTRRQVLLTLALLALVALAHAAARFTQIGGAQFAPSVAIYVLMALILAPQLGWGPLLGIAAASLIFLSAYGGMLSLAQTAIFGIAGFSLANIVTSDVTGGQNLGWNPWLGVVLAIAIATSSPPMRATSRR